jgi:hypothetical protein
MRQGQQNNKRMRGRNRKGPNPLTRSYESNGGDVKLRGTALHIAEKYVQLARDAQSFGDRVAAENYFQHAEHYYRIVSAAQAQMPQPQPIIRNDDDDIDEEGDGEFRINGTGLQGPTSGGERQQGPGGYGMSDPQPYLNGASEADDDGNDGFPPRENMNGGGGQRYGGQGQGQRQEGQGQGQRQEGQGQRQDGQGQRQDGQGQRQDGQGHFRRRRFRDRYDNRDNRDRNGTGDRPAGERNEPAPRSEVEGRSDSSSESNED